MANTTDSALTTTANVIGNETTDGANTADRVRDMLIDVIDSKINNDKIETDVGLATPNKTVAGRDAVKSYIDTAVTTIGNGKDATGGYAGLTLFKINFKNALNTFTSFFTNANTAARTYTFQDRDGTVADLTDVKTTTFNRQTTHYTLVLGDAGKAVEMNSASANNLTVPLNSSVAFDIGTNIYLIQYGAGLTTVVATGGVTINSSSGGLTAPSQHSVMLLQKVGTDEWRLTNGTAIGEWTTISSPSWAGFGTAVTGTMKYVKIGKMVTLSFRSAALGVSNTTAKTLTLPFAAAAQFTGPVTGITNSGTASDTVGAWFTTASSTTLDIYRNSTTFTWTASGNCRFDFIVTYESTT